MSLLTAGALVYVSLNHLPFFYYHYVRIGTAISLAACGFFFYKRMVLNSYKRLAIILIITTISLASIFLFHNGKRADWIIIDRLTAVFLLAPVLAMGYELFKQGGKVVDFENIKTRTKEGLSTLFGLLIWVAVIGGIIYWANIKDGDSEYNLFIAMTAENQLIELAPWSDYTGSRWLNLNKNGTYNIKTGKLSDDSWKTVANGKWEFDSVTNTLTLSSANSEELFGYMLQSEQAFLGDNPVENTPLSKLWFSIPPAPKEGFSNPE